MNVFREFSQLSNGIIRTKFQPFFTEAKRMHPNRKGQNFNVRKIKVLDSFCLKFCSKKLKSYESKYLGNLVSYVIASLVCLSWNKITTNKYKTSKMHQVERIKIINSGVLEIQVLSIFCIKFYTKSYKMVNASF